jgi:hypothetical protein
MQLTKSATLFLAVFALNAWGLEVNRYLSGSWYNPNQSGHGFSVEVLSPSRTLFYWYSYHPDGTPMFIVADGTNSGNRVTATAYYNTGMRFGEFNPADRMQTQWGTITLTFHSCNSATLQYNSNIMHHGTAYGSGSLSLVRLANIDKMQCSSAPAAGLYSGNFYSRRLNQVIPGFAAIAPNGEFAAVSFDAMAAVGTWSMSGRNFTGGGTAVSADPRYSFNSRLSISGQLSPGYAVWGDYSVTGGDYGYMEFYAVPDLYRRGISLDAIAGSYTAKNLVSGGTGTATISSSGGVSGSDSFGCRYQGQLSVPDEHFNLLAVTVTVSNCSVSDGRYNGYGAQIDYYNLEDRRAIRLLGTNGKYAGIIDLY